MNFFYKIGPGKIIQETNRQFTKPKKIIGLEGYVSLVIHNIDRGIWLNRKKAQIIFKIYQGKSKKKFK